MRKIIFSSGFLLANSQVLCVLIGCNRQLLLIKIYAGISNIFKKVHHLLKLRASNKGIKQMLFLLFRTSLIEHFMSSYFTINNLVFNNNLFWIDRRECQYLLEICINEEIRHWYRFNRENLQYITDLVHGGLVRGN